MGDIKAPRVGHGRGGARFRGAVDMDVKLPAGLSRTGHSNRNHSQCQRPAKWTPHKTVCSVPRSKSRARSRATSDLVIQGKIHGKTHLA